MVRWSELSLTTPPMMMPVVALPDAPHHIFPPPWRITFGSRYVLAPESPETAHYVLGYVDGLSAVFCLVVVPGKVRLELKYLHSMRRALLGRQDCVQEGAARNQVFPL